MEAWNFTLRQRLACFVRKTLSFSKSDFMHQLVLKGFIAVYTLCVTKSRVNFHLKQQNGHSFSLAIL